MDMLVKLYELQSDHALGRRMRDDGVAIRRILPPELKLLTDWIEPRFGIGWVGEATVATMRQPPTCFVAIKDEEIVGFACHEATMRGFFGPTGVDDAMRGKGIGQALLLACLLDMKALGYGYAIIGGAGPLDFYKKTVGAIPIEGSVPGIYKGMLPLERPDEEPPLEK